MVLGDRDQALDSCIIVLPSKIGSERESGKTCILRGFLKGSYFAPPAAQTADSRQNGR